MKRVAEREPAACDLILAGESVTGKKSFILREAFSRPAIRRHIMDRCAWREEVFDSVHWEALGRAMRKLTISQQTTVCKHCNDILPMGRILKYRNTTESIYCLSCKSNTVESFEHMIHCPGHSDWRVAARKNIEDSLLETNTPKDLRNTLLDSLFAVPGNDDLPLRHPALQEIRDTCADIGTLEMWRGRIPLAASAFVHAYKTKDLSKEYVGKEDTTWATAFILEVLKQFLILWGIRNSTRHGGDDIAKGRIRHEKACARCVEVGKKVDLMRKEDASLFAKPAVTLKWKTNKMLAYLEWAEPLAEKCARTPKATGDSGKWDATKGELPKPP